MSLHKTFVACLLTTTVSWSLVAAGRAQQPADPVDDAATADPAPPARPAAPVRAGAQPPAAASEAPPPLETDPTVLSALERPRKEPRDYVEAILWLIDLERPQLAKQILEDLKKLTLTDAQRAAIVEEFGSQGMLHLARAKELAPDGAAFADECMKAAAAAASDPQRIAALVAQLSDPNVEVRIAARHDLAATGQAGVTATLEALARETDPQRRTLLLAAIALMRPLTNGPLLAMLDTSDDRLRADVSQLVQKLEVPAAAPLAAAGLATSEPRTAERALAAAIENYKSGTPPFTPDAANEIELWKWDDATKKLSSFRAPADEAQVIWIGRLARELVRVRPGDYAHQREALLLHLESAGLTGAASTSHAEFLARVDTPALNDVLADALESNYHHAAEALLIALAARGDVGVLATANARPAPVVEALSSASPRVRFAALLAIMRLNPATPYAGSSRVPETLEWFSTSRGERRVAVAMPTLAAATHLAGQLNALEFSAEATNRGRNLVELARQSSDVELILVDMDILVPHIRQVLYELRIQPESAEIPIGLLAAAGRLEAAQKLADEHTRVIAAPRPHTAETLGRLVGELLRRSARNAVPAPQRAAQAEQARTWLAALMQGNRPFYTFRAPSIVTSPASRAPAPPALPSPPAPAPESLPAP